MPASPPFRACVQEILEYPFSFLANEIRIVFVLQGSLQMKFVAGTVAVEAGDMEIINVNEPVGLAGSPGNQVMIASIDGNFARGLYPNIDKTSLNCNPRYVFPGSAAKSDKGRLRALVSEMLDLAFADPAAFQAVAGERTQALLRFLVEHFNSITNALRNVPNAQLHLPRFKNIDSYIQENMGRKLTLSDVASQEYVSMQYLANEFKKKYGLTFNEILSYYRVIHSVRLLLGTQLSMLEISEKSGFSSTRYYYKYFKKHLLISPNEFRKQNQRASVAQNTFRELNLREIWQSRPFHDAAIQRTLRPKNMRRVLLINPNTTEATTRRLERAARSAFSSDILMTAINIPFGPDVLRTDLDETLSEIAVLEALLEHQGNYDGAIIACFSDLGIKIAKKMLSVPVISIAEAAYYSAGLFGEHFGVITSGGDIERRLIHAAIRRCGVESNCTSVRSLNVNYLDIDDGIQDKLEALVLSCKTQEGADAVVLACSSLAGMGDAISQRHRIPVLDGITQAAVFMEGMLSPAWRRMTFPPDKISSRSVFTGTLSVKNIERAYLE